MLTKDYKCSILRYNYIYENYILTNYQIYRKMRMENFNTDWAYNVCFIEKYLKDK